MAMVGYPASDNALVAALEIGLDIKAHRSRPFSIGLLERARRVYCLAKGHRDFLAPYLEGQPGTVELLEPNGKDIRDPYGRSLKVYRKVTSQIVKACQARAEELLGGAR
jgi:protein-tyrosine phosphatase